MLAIMPPPELTRNIEQVRFEFASAYNCKAALKPPVHITLIPPYKATANRVIQLVPMLETWAATQIPFPVTLENYASFSNNGVVYMDVAKNDLLQLFQQDLRKRFLEILPVPEVKKYTSFHPHITIGYRDIPKEFFHAAEREYLSRNFFATFITDRFYLWKHSGYRWEVIKSFDMGNKAVSEKLTLF